MQRFTFIKSCGCSSFDLPGKEEVEAGPTNDGGSSESLGDSICQQYQLVEDCSFGSFVILRFASAHWSDFSQLESIWVDRCGSGFGRSRDIKAQDVEKQRNKDPVTSFHGVGPFLLRGGLGECFVEALNAIKENTGLPLLPSWNDKSGIWAFPDDHGRSILVFEGISGNRAGR